MKILFLGDIVGRPARDYLVMLIPRLRQELAVDAVIANAENVAGGSGITVETAKILLNCGIDALTTGDHIFKKNDAKDVLENFDVLRPLNYGNFAWGRGHLVKAVGNKKIGIINLQGRVFMQPIDCPFNAVRAVLEEMRLATKVIVVDMHAEATSEKLAMGYFLSGKVSAVLGTHTHIPTADERIIDDFTAYISDVGMTGSCDSILGREKHKVIERFVTNMPVRFDLANGDVRLQGVVLNVDEDTGRALSIERVEYKQDNL